MHPTKIEVRFRDSREVHQAVRHAVENALRPPSAARLRRRSPLQPVMRSISSPTAPSARGNAQAAIKFEERHRRKTSKHPGRRAVLRSPMADPGWRCGGGTGLRPSRAPVAARHHAQPRPSATGGTARPPAADSRALRPAPRPGASNPSTAWPGRDGRNRWPRQWPRQIHGGLHPGRNARAWWWWTCTPRTSASSTNA